MMNAAQLIKPEKIADVKTLWDECKYSVVGLGLASLIAGASAGKTLEIMSIAPTIGATVSPLFLLFNAAAIAATVGLTAFQAHLIKNELASLAAPVEENEQSAKAKKTESLRTLWNENKYNILGIAVETVAAGFFAGRISGALDVASRIGATASPAFLLFNAGVSAAILSVPIIQTALMKRNLSRFAAPVPKG